MLQQGRGGAGDGSCSQMGGEEEVELGEREEVGATAR